MSRVDMREGGYAWWCERASQANLLALLSVVGNALTWKVPGCDASVVPDAYDSDANENEIPDNVDPHLPGGPSAGCDVSDPAACCSTLADCVSTLAGTALYADGRLLLRDGTQVLETLGIADTGPYATIVNAGSLESELGVEATVHDLLSDAPVLLRDRAVVRGNVVSEDMVEVHNLVEVSGDIFEFADLDLLTLDDFVVEIPFSTNHVVTTSAVTLAPGAYGAVTVQPGGSLSLQSGVYFVQSFDLEPSTTLQLDLGSGPIYLYVDEGFI